MSGRRGQVYDPIPAEHPGRLTDECLICGSPLGEDGPVQGLLLGSAVVLVDAPCLSGMDDVEVEGLVAELVADNSWRRSDD